MEAGNWVWRVRLSVLAMLLVVCIAVWWPTVGGADRGPERGLSAAVAEWWSGVRGSTSDTAPVLSVAFLDVGQGDAIFIETPDGVQMLVDGGPDTTVLRALGEVMPWYDRSLDVVLATHFDLDHIGGLVDVLSRYDVETIMKTSNQNDTTATEAFLTAVDAESGSMHFTRAGDVLQLGASTTFTILSPAGDPTQWESNNASIVGILRYGEVDLLLTGDAGTGIEEYLVRTYGAALQSEVLKLGHHGSNTSSSELFLQTVQPALAVVSAGADNRYGHPHPDVVARTTTVGAQILSTAEQGTIVLKSDGVRVWVE